MYNQQQQGGYNPYGHDAMQAQNPGNQFPNGIPHQQATMGMQQPPMMAPPSYDEGMGMPMAQPMTAQPMQQGFQGYQPQAYNPHQAGQFQQPPNIPVAIPVAEPIAHNGRGELYHPGEWSAELCGCCDDCGTCCLGFFCPCYLFGKTIGMAELGEAMIHMSLYGIIYILYNVFIAYWWAFLFWLALSFYGGYFRGKIREKYGIDGNILSDWCLHVCCLYCSLCQEHSHVRNVSSQIYPMQVRVQPVQRPSMAQPGQPQPPRL